MAKLFAFIKQRKKVKNSKVTIKDHNSVHTNRKTDNQAQTWKDILVNERKQKMPQRRRIEGK